MTNNILIENQKNQEYIEKTLDNLKNLFLDKFIIVHNQEVVAICSTFQEASEYGVKKYGINEAFLIYHVEDKKPVNFVIHAIPTDYTSHKQSVGLAFH
jgi:hypothetical protein